MNGITDSPRLQHLYIAQAVLDLLAVAYQKSDSYLDDVERLMRAGFRSVETGSCLSAVPSGLEQQWKVFVTPIAEFTTNEAERKLMLFRALLAIGEEVARHKYAVTYKDSLLLG